MRVAVRDRSKTRDVPLAADTFVDDRWLVVDDPGTDIVVEVIGGIEPASSSSCRRSPTASPWSPRTRSSSRTHGDELFDAADAAGLDLAFEAAVAGGIPLIRPLKESLAGERVDSRARHRERHDELHPHADVRARVVLRRRARGGAAARLRRGRSHRRRRGVRRRREVRDPRLDRVQHRRVVSATSTARASPA